MEIHTVHCHLFVCGTSVCNHIKGILHLQHKRLWKVSLNQSLCVLPDGSMLLPQHMEDLQFHPSPGFRNNSASRKNCFNPAFVCPTWKMMIPLLMYGMKKKKKRDLPQRASGDRWVSYSCLEGAVFLSLVVLWGTFKDTCCAAAFTLVDAVLWPWMKWLPSLSITSSAKKGKAQRH